MPNGYLLDTFYVNPSPGLHVYGTGSVKIWKTRHKIYSDILIFFTVYAVSGAGF